jgi:hypothetical protein
MTIRELREVQQQAAVVAMQLVAREHALLARLRRILHRGFVEKAGIDGNAAEVTRVHHDSAPSTL